VSNNLKSILKSVALIGLITVLLTPSALNLVHSFEHHEHLIDCDEKDKTHLHEVEFDCSFIQLYATPHTYDSVFYTPLKNRIKYYSLSIVKYSCEYFQNKFIKNSPYRGPPVLSS